MQVDVGKEFSPSLTNRDHLQRDGKNTGVDFRKKYLISLDDKGEWQNSSTFITLDFGNVKRLGPSWANEVFAYFTKYANPELVLKKISIKNISRVKESIIKQELNTGYYER